MRSPRSAPLAALALFLAAGASAQTPGVSGLPPTSPTNANAGSVAPLSAVATAADRAGARRHRAQVTCTGGELDVRADNSSLNSILRAVAQCTGMKITGGVPDQRVYGNYGPAMPATVIATLLDGTGTNILLRETAQDQPSKLILTPRTGGPTPPSPSQAGDDDPPEDNNGPGAVSALYGNAGGGGHTGGNGNAGGSGNTGYGGNGSYRGNAGSRPGPPNPRGNFQGNQPGANMGVPANAASPGSVSGPPSIAQPFNNVMGSPNNTSPDAGTYPTTNSVPLDSLPTPSTTPYQTGIVTAPNPVPEGSDTTAFPNGNPANTPGNTAHPDQPSPTGTTGAPESNPNGSGTPGTAGSNGTLTPQQVFDQLQRLRQQANPQ